MNENYSAGFSGAGWPGAEWLDDRVIKPSQLPKFGNGLGTELGKRSSHFYALLNN